MKSKSEISSKFLVLMLLAALFICPAHSMSQTTPTAGPAVQTDKTAYVAGETIAISGSGFMPYEGVALQVKHADGTAESGMGHDPWYVSANADGAFTATWSVNSQDSAGPNFLLAAAGSSGSNAQFAFSRIATLTTNKPSYQPGETAYIAGTGFLPNEIVALQITPATGLMKSQNRAASSIVSDASGNISASSSIQSGSSGSTLLSLTAEGMVSGVQAAVVTAVPSSFFFVTDQDGANDQPGQKDLTMMGRDDSNTSLLKIFWNWDDVSFSGQRGDACALFDSNGNGNIDFAVCGEVENAGNPNDQVVVQTSISPTVWNCGDVKPDRCTQPLTQVTSIGNTVAGPLGTSVMDRTSNLVTGLDPFSSGSFFPLDTTLQVNIDRSILPSGAVLVNVCSYPSIGAGGNSDPSDCITTPGGGFLVISKNAGTDQSTPFTFTVSPVPNQINTFTINGSGSTLPIGLLIGTNTESVTESVPLGWNFQSASCVLSDGTTATGTPGTNSVTGITIESGLVTTCTFTNLRKPHLKLVKAVINDNGGTAVATDWTLSAAGPTPFSGAGGAESDVTAGTYTLSESTGPSGYTPGAWSCPGFTLSGGNQITLAAGDNATCTITNDDVAATLIVKKHVINDNSGTKTAADFTMNVTGSSPSPASFAGSEAGTSVTLNAGSYSVDEAADSGYTKSIGANCSGTIANGETKTCTITNDDKAGTLIVIKHVINDNGGSKTAANFTLTVTGSSPSPASFAGSEAGTSVTLSAGSYSVDEAADPGYTKGLSADCSGTIANGETKTCTITNDDKAGTLIVIKHVINDNGGTKTAPDFTVTVTGSSPSPASFVGSEAGTSVTLNAGSYSVDEAADSGYTKSIGANCSGTIANGDTKTCTITNDDKAATLTVIKHVINNNGGGKNAANFSMTVTGTNVQPSATFAGNEAGTTVTLNAGSYSVDEAADSAYTKSIGANCSGTIANGETKTCTITNDDKAATLTVIKHVINDNSGTKTAANFSMTVTGTNVQPSATFPGSEAGTTVTLNAGSYSVDEAADSGYTKSIGANCSGTIANGDSKTCTITNDDKAGTLIVIKHVINNNGGTKTAANFSMTVTGTNVQPSATFPGSEVGTTVTLSAGSYSVDEAADSAYTKSIGANCSGTIANGDTKTCTITNDDKAATLTVIKHVINDNGGAKTAANFTLTVTGGSPSPASFAGSEAGTTVTLNAGSYSVDEAADSGYTKLIGADCSGTIANGDSKTCTITNDDKAATLIVKKHVINDNGGTKTAANFTLTVTGGSPSPASFAGSETGTTVTLNAGSYSVDEAADASYAKSIGANCSGTIANGDTKTCTITNDDIPPMLKIVKAIVPSTDPGKFDLVLDSTTTYTCGGTGCGNGGATPFVIVSPGMHSVSESAHSGTSLSDYVSSISCDNGASGDGATLSGIPLSLADMVTCTITNKRLPQLKVVKILIPNSDPGRFDLLIDSTTYDNGGSGFGNGGTTGFVDVSMGPHTVGEQAHNAETNLNTYAHSISCTNGANNAATGDTTLSVGTLNAGDVVTCTIANVIASSKVTDSSLCPLPNDQFNLLYIQDTASTFRLTASNPGQFYDNAFFKEDAGKPVTFSITIPYPFVTQGAVPIQLHSLVSLNSSGCFVPIGDVTSSFQIAINNGNGTNVSTSGAPVILLGDYGSPRNMGETVTVTFTGNIPASGLIYATIHLDYGLKPTNDPTTTGAPISTDWTKGDSNSAVGAMPTSGPYNVSGVTVHSPQAYTFDFNIGSTLVSEGVVSSVNTFKRDPGFAGVVTGSSPEDLRANVKVQIYDPFGALLGTVYTDQYGMYFFEYKYTGKAAPFTVKLPDYNQSKTVTLKSNGIVGVDFIIP